MSARKVNASLRTNRMRFWITAGDPKPASLRFAGMETLARHLSTNGALASATAIRYSRRTRVGGSERSGGMVSETPNATSDAARWAALIEAVATREDREAFATLFEYFAPRIKTFMR